MRALLAVSGQGRNDAVAIWAPNQIFDKSDREGDISQERSPFRIYRFFSLAYCSSVSSSQTPPRPTEYDVAGALVALFGKRIPRISKLKSFAATFENPTNVLAYAECCSAKVGVF